MRAGELKERIIVQRPTVTKSDYGSEDTEYNDLYSVRAEVRYKEGTRINDDGEMTLAYTVKFIIRQHYLPDEKDIILFKGKKYRILSIVMNRDKQYNEINTELINE
jgi:SPP1 family predicted phage head-tail adaptor